MLDEPAERYGEDAVVTASPYMDDNGDTIRWILEINGAPITDADIRLQPQADRPDSW